MLVFQGLNTRFMNFRILLGQGPACALYVRDEVLLWERSEEASATGHVSRETSIFYNKAGHFSGIEEWIKMVRLNCRKKKLASDLIEAGNKSL